jgi:hypothetical protein
VVADWVVGVILRALFPVGSLVIIAISVRAMSTRLVLFGRQDFGMQELRFPRIRQCLFNFRALRWRLSIQVFIYSDEQKNPHDSRERDREIAKSNVSK